MAWLSNCPCCGHEREFETETEAEEWFKTLRVPGNRGVRVSKSSLTELERAWEKFLDDDDTYFDRLALAVRKVLAART